MILYATFPKEILVLLNEQPGSTNSPSFSLNAPVKGIQIA